MNGPWNASPRTGDHRRWLVLGMAVAWNSVLVCPDVTGAQKSQATIPVVADFSEHEALSAGLQRRIRDAVRRRLESRSRGQVSWTVMPAEWQQRAGRKRPSELTPEMCRHLKLDRGVQGLVLWVDYQRGTYHLVCAVFHREFNDVIVSRTVDVVDRRIVVNNAERLVQRVWRSVGEIVESRESSLVVSMSSAETGSPDALVKSGTPLEVVWVARDREEDRRKVWPGGFLVVNENRDASMVQAKAVGRGGRISEFFRDVGDSRVRYFVRSIEPRDGPTRIQVVSESTGRPREACAVYVRNEKPPRVIPQGTPDGLTDEAGLFVVPFRSRGFRYVTVVCGFRFRTTPIASGQDGVPLVLSLPRHTPQKQKEAVRNRILRRINEVNEWVNVMTRSVNQSVAARDETAIENAITVLERNPEWQQIRRELKELRRSMTGSGRSPLDTFVQADLVRLEVSRRDWQSKIDAVRTNLRTIRSDRLIAEYRAAQKAFKWSDAVSALERLLEVVPNRQPAKTLLARLRRALPEHSQQHAFARQAARNHVRAESTADVLSVWNDLETSVRVLIREDDGPVLWELSVGLQELIAVLDRDSKALIKKIQTDGDDLSEAEQEQLVKRGKAIGKALTGLAAVRKDAVTLVREFFLLGGS